MPMIMNEAASDNHPIADNFWFVFLAYFLAIATWSILASHDFLSSSWETVARTRKVGRRHLAVVIPPMAYMCVYMYYQIKAGDYKEFNAALVALGFAVLHMARTIMGLWQLHVFKQWVVRSIISMESLRCSSGMISGGNDMAKLMQRRESIEERKRRVNEEADKVLVNETIVDNRLFEGEVRCKLRLINEKQQEEIERAGNWLTRVLLRCMYTLSSALRIVGVIWPLVFSKSSAFSTPTSVPYLVPREPEELYLRWSIVLVSRAFPEWVSDMAKSRFEAVAKQVSEYGTRRDRFATEILYSAALHTSRPSVGTRGKTNCEEGTGNGQERNSKGHETPVHRLLPYEHWCKFPKLCSGKFCKDEFLAHACSSGAGLPFSAPHTLVETTDATSVSYSPFRSKLNRARDSLPADEAEKVADFDVEALEWLTVCLCVSDWNASRTMNTAERAEERNTMDHPAASESSAEKSIDVFSNQRGMRTDIAVQNLANQLGFDLDSRSFLAIFSNPYLRGAEDNVLWGNRNVLEASLHVDNWLAICGGEQMAYMANEIPDTEIGALICKSEGEGVWKECVRLEQLRFMFQVSDLNPEQSYCDQSLMFMGVSMESLRSMLAEWVEANGQTQGGAWSPEIKSGGGNATEIEDEKGLQFTARADFEYLLCGITSEESLSLRFVKMRLLSEIQSMLHCVLFEQGCCPERTAALILCVLSFPALCFEVKKKEKFQSDLESIGGTGKHFCCIQITEEENREFDIADYIVTVRAALSPQSVHVDISFSRTSEESGIVVTVHLCDEESEEERLFKWGLWRNAFVGSLEGIRLGKEQHGFQCDPVFQSHRGIEFGTCTIDTSNSGTGTSMKTWAGWLPWNPAICKYELMTDSFIMQLKTVGRSKKNPVEVQREGYIYNIEVSQHEYEPTQYGISSAGALQHASMIAHDFLRRASESTTFPLDEWNSSISEDICSRADSILKGGKKSAKNAALVLYEIAASELGNASSLCKAIDILVAEQNSIDAEERSIALLERFYLADCGNPVQTRRSAALRSRFQDKKWVSLVRSQYKILITRATNCTKSLISYAHFCVLLFTHGEEEALDDGIRAISKALMQFLQPQHSFSAWELRNCFLHLIGEERKELFYLEAATLKKFIHLFDSVKEQEQNKVPQRTSSINTDVTIDQFQSALNDLAFLLANGAEGVPRDAPRAMELYTRAIEQGANVSAMYNLARLLENGAEGVPRDALRAVELYTRAIEQDAHVYAMNNLAFLLQNGAEGVPPDAPRAVELYTRAIEQGAYVSAMYNLAFLLQNGAEGVPRDAPRAVELYTRAIEQDADVDTMYNLALLLENGAEGVPRDALRAVELYTRAIEQGAHVYAMYNLAFLLQNGAEGVPRDVPRAAELSARAIAQGDRL